MDGRRSLRLLSADQLWSYHFVRREAFAPYRDTIRYHWTDMQLILPKTGLKAFLGVKVSSSRVLLSICVHNALVEQAFALLFVREGKELHMRRVVQDRDTYQQRTMHHLVL